MRQFYLVTLLYTIATVTFAQAPSGYYSDAQNKYGQELMVSLHGIIKDHTTLSYTPGLWNAFYDTDMRSDGKVWDMYSSCTFTFGSDQDSGSGGTNECEYYNREHSFPRSWFGGAIDPMNTDLFHIYPTDKKVNAVRSDYPFGEVGTATYTSSNGSKLGNSSYAGYSGTVFEPIDEYKGDFARSYFYMATRYYDRMHTWSNDVTNGTQFPAFEEWVVNLLLEWHKNDPVSEKEINRNNAIFEKYQHNRNPFIDHPEFVLRIWGDETSSDYLENEYDFCVYPNPAQDKVYISSSYIGEGEITIYSPVGVEIKRFKKGSHTESTQIPTSDLPSGIYLLLIKTESFQKTTRLVIAK
ncbi:endonuclease [Perlabentimonas gracilis]|uniref:endonuclease n=1 Tax=Perlabentimonas gracilis TaxID=2715279 RepID=UPI001408164B|nr:endonuclease [Perlabentimonas gracilis]NHB70180.1 T9SS type A sorting domain-containing protein [Perlabentimonas gracilis]